MSHDVFERNSVEAFSEEGAISSAPDDGSASSRTLTRADLAEAVHRQAGFSRTESAQLVEAFLEEIFDAIVSGDDVKLSSFGSFHVRLKSERVGRNPKTGETAPICARRVVTFKASPILRARVQHPNATT